MSTVNQQYNQFKVEHDTLQKMLNEEQIRLANLQSGIMRTRLGLEFQKHGVTREPVGFIVGGNGQ